MKWLQEGAYVKFIGDNVDERKTVRDIRSDHHDTLHHMYSMLAVKARAIPPPPSTPFVRPNLTQLPARAFLPNRSHLLQLKCNLTILVSRVLCEHITPLMSLSKLIPRHIYHEHTSEMSQQSETVVLDVLHRNEAKHEDMLVIMRTMQSYLGEHNSEVLSGGDQLTCERQRGSKRHVMDGDTPQDRLDALHPVIEDWHALQSFLKVYILSMQLIDHIIHMCTSFQLIWKLLYKRKSRDHGTLGHLCSLLGRLPQANDPKKYLHACLDVLMTIFRGHIIAAACNELGMNDMDSVLPLSAQLKMGNEGKNRSFIVNLASQIVDKYTVVSQAFMNEQIEDCGDGVHNYTRIMCHLASLVMEFTDAWAEGDGERVMSCW